MGKPTKGRHPQRDAFGERVARERAARRRKAKERAQRETTQGDAEKGLTEAPAAPEVVEIPEADLMNELSVLAALIASGLARHHTEARRLFRDAGIEVNDQPVISDKAKLRLSDVTADGSVKLSLVGGRSVLLRPV